MKKTNKAFATYIFCAIPAILGLWAMNRYVHIIENRLFLLLCFYILSFAIILFFTNKYIFPTFFFLLTLVTGIYGYTQFAIQTYPFTNALYSTFRLFILDLDNVFAPQENPFVRLPMAIEIARWSAVLYFFSTIAQILYFFLGKSMKLYYYRFFGHHFIVFGFNPHTKILIQNLRSQKERVVLIAENLSDSEREYLDELGVLVLLGSKGDFSLYQRAGLRKASYVLLFQNDSKNLNELLSIKMFFQSIDQSHSRLKICIHLVKQRSYALFEEIEKEIREQFESVPFLLKTTNVHRLMAEKLFADHPLYRGYEARVRDPNGEPLHLVFLGFDSVNQQVAFAAMERAHFLTREKLMVTVLEHDIQKVETEWYREFPKSGKVARIAFHSLSQNQLELDVWLKNLSPAPTHLFVSLGSDLTSILEGIFLAKKLRDFPVFIHIQEDDLISRRIQHDQKQYHNLQSFGYYNDVLNKEYVINEEFDQLAKIHHENYRQIKVGSKVDSWERLTDLKRESNRGLFNHASTKMALMGLDVIPKDSISLQKGQVLSKEEFLSLAQDVLEALAEVEHRRWCAFHYLRGWDVKPFPSPGDTRDEVEKLHGCLVSWEELDQVSARVGEDYKQYDRNTIIQLYDMWQSIGYQVIKRNEKGE